MRKFFQALLVTLLLLVTSVGFATTAQEAKKDAAALVDNDVGDVVLSIIKVDNLEDATTLQIYKIAGIDAVALNYDTRVERQEVSETTKEIVKPSKTTYRKARDSLRKRSLTER